MKTYKVEVTEYGEPEEGKSYPQSKTIYAQTLEKLNLAALIAVINGLSGPAEREQENESP